jgi:TRAP-type C4-dicarboxylate transport system permease small subunit
MSVSLSGALTAIGIGHARIDLLPPRIKGLPNKILRLFNSLVEVAFVILLFLGAVNQALVYWQSGRTVILGGLNFPQWIIFSLFSAFILPLVIAAIYQVIKIAIELPKKTNEEAYDFAESEEEESL